MKVPSSFLPHLCFSHVTQVLKNRPIDKGLTSSLPPSMDQNSQHDYYANHEERDATSRCSVSLVFFRFYKLFHAFLGMIHSGLHIVIDSIKDCTLIDYQNCQLFENLS